MKRILISLFVMVVSASAMAMPSDYNNLCPSQITFIPLGQSVYGWWKGSNSDGAGFLTSAPHNPPQPSDPQKGVVLGLNGSLTDFVAVSNTMRCVYIIKNTHGYNVNTPLYNHGFYHQCSNGKVIPATQVCSK